MKFSPSLEQYRIVSGPQASGSYADYGAFELPGPCGQTLFVIASSGNDASGVDWEHVSVSLKNRCPNWTEMCHVKNLFWDAEETVIQFHPPQSQWINIHSYVLHLWRPKKQEIPLPPRIAV